MYGDGYITAAGNKPIRPIDTIRSVFQVVAQLVSFLETVALPAKRAITGALTNGF